MRLDRDGFDLIKRYEGFSAVPYFDQAGKLTIGYGHLILAGEIFPKRITISEAEELLNKDTDIAVGAVNRLVTVDLTQNQFNALVSFTYNLGGGAFKKSILLSRINAGENIEAVNFTSWNKVRNQDNLLVESRGLTFRRHDELEIFLA